MYLRNVEDKGQYIGSVNLCQTGFGIEGCLICIVVGDVASEGTEGGSNVITGIPTKFVSAAFGCELQVYHDGTACSVLGRLIHPFQQKFDI